MFTRSLLFLALVLATPTLIAQTTKPAPQPQRAADRYVPAIMHERMQTLSGCLQQNPEWRLTDATLAGQKEAATYKLDGIGEARLLVLAGKQVEATGAIVAASPAPPGGKPAAGSGGPPLPRFEATALREVAATCS